MRIAEKERKTISYSNQGTTGVKWHWVPGSNIPDPNKVEKYNSEAVTVPITLSLFADDTIFVGERKELQEGIQIVKDVMSQFEEKNNEDKEEVAVFGTSEAEEIRMLGSWLGPKGDLKKSKKEQESFGRNAGHS